MLKSFLSVFIVFVAFAQSALATVPVAVRVKHSSKGTVKTMTINIEDAVTWNDFSFRISQQLLGTIYVTNEPSRSQSNNSSVSILATYALPFLRIKGGNEPASDLTLAQILEQYGNDGLLEVEMFGTVVDLRF